LWEVVEEVVDEVVGVVSENPRQIKQQKAGVPNPKAHRLFPG
jgi:hypothetical protein